MTLAVDWAVKPQHKQNVRKIEFVVPIVPVLQMYMYLSTWFLNQLQKRNKVINDACRSYKNYISLCMFIWLSLTVGFRRQII